MIRSRIGMASSTRASMIPSAMALLVCFHMVCAASVFGQQRGAVVANFSGVPLLRPAGDSWAGPRVSCSEMMSCAKTVHQERASRHDTDSAFLHFLYGTVATGLGASFIYYGASATTTDQQAFAIGFGAFSAVVGAVSFLRGIEHVWVDSGR